MDAFFTEVVGIYTTAVAALTRVVLVRVRVYHTDTFLRCGLTFSRIYGIRNFACITFLAERLCQRGMTRPTVG